MRQGIRRVPLRRVMLVKLPCRRTAEVPDTWTPLGVARLAALLREAGIQATVYDATRRVDGIEFVAKRIRYEQPDIVAVAPHTATTPVGLAVLREAKRENPNAVTVIGGAHATSVASETLGYSYVDYVVRLGGEDALPELVECLNVGENPTKVCGLSYREAGHVHHTPDRGSRRDLGTPTYAPQSA